MRSPDPEIFVKDLFEALRVFPIRRLSLSKTKSYLPTVPAAQSRKRPAEVPLQVYSNKQPRQQYNSYPVQSSPPTPTSWPGISGHHPVPWPGQGPPPPGWNAVPPNMIAMVPVNVPMPALPQRIRPQRRKGTCFDYMERGICLRGAAVYLSVESLI
jgi:hypothetical protein